MARIDDIQGDQRMRLANQYETFLRSMVLLRGDQVTADQMGNIVDRAVASASPEERRNPVPSPDAISRLQQFLSQATEAGRPRNDFSAEAARAAQAAGGSDGQRGGVGFGYIDALRARSSERFRDLPAGDSVKSTGTSGSSGAVTPEFARSFAGSGMVGGTLRTFAEVGLDRGTFDAFRREGFSKAQIADSARDSKVLGWHGRDDLAIAQHASPDARKAAVATEQATTPAQREERLKRERALEEQNEARPDSDPQKQHNRRFFQRRHHDHQQHSARAGLGSESRQHDAALPSPKDKADKAEHQGQDGLMAKGAERVAKNATVATMRIETGFEVEAETPASATAKPAPTKIAAAKPLAPAQG